MLVRAKIKGLIGKFNWDVIEKQFDIAIRLDVVYELSIPKQNNFRLTSVQGRIIRYSSRHSLPDQG